MGTETSLTDESTAWLAPSIAAAHHGPAVLRATWQAMAVAGTLPRDIDISDPNAVDWERITDVLLGMAAFVQRLRQEGLPQDGLWCRDDDGRLVEILLPSQGPLGH